MEKAVIIVGASLDTTEDIDSLTTWLTAEGLGEGDFTISNFPYLGLTETDATLTVEVGITSLARAADIVQRWAGN